MVDLGGSEQLKRSKADEGVAKMVGVVCILGTDWRVDVGGCVGVGEWIGEWVDGDSW